MLTLSPTTWWCIGIGLLIVSGIAIGFVFWRGLKKPSSPLTADSTSTEATTPVDPTCPPATNKTKDNIGCTIILVTIIIGISWGFVTCVGLVDKAISKNASVPSPAITKQEDKHTENFTIPAGQTVEVKLASGFRHWTIQAQAPDEDARWEICYKQISFLAGNKNLSYQGGGPGSKDKTGPNLTTRSFRLRNLESRTVKIEVSSW
ncbi:MAG TPA: hypothetical protein P5274_02785 [Candidatus Paceibacterota bacterium]|nr:hypothetical protein [Candidatus Paceibacterota bacterium]